MGSPVFEPRLQSDQHDTVLLLALGALSLAHTFERSVERRAAADAKPLNVDDPVVVAALGAIGLGRSLQRWLAEATGPTVRRDPPPLPDPSFSSSGLLR